MKKQRRPLFLLVVALVLLAVFIGIYTRNRNDLFKGPYEGIPKDLIIAGIYPNQNFANIPEELRNELKTDGKVQEYMPEVWGEWAKYCALLYKVYESQSMRIITTQLNPAYVEDIKSRHAGTEGMEAVEAMEAELGVEFIREIRLLDNKYETYRGLRIGDAGSCVDEKYTGLGHRTGGTDSDFTFETTGTFQLIIVVEDNAVTEIVSANNGTNNGKSYA